MLVDFKALRLAVQEHIERFDHSMAVNSEDPLLPALLQQYPEDAVIVFQGLDPTTEVFARDVYEHVAKVLRDGFESGHYRIPAGVVEVDRVRVWETPSSWAEYGA
jgi:6-pyruvoyltetrahydropterin/6-carboxytetrahydropterin synthase